MSSATRLLDLVQTLRRHRTPVTAERLAELLGISVRSIYRDIESLRGQGATIAGEAGVGYVLKPGFLLPPLMFTDDELEAMVLGLRMVEHQGDSGLQKAAQEVTAKLRAVLPSDLRATLDESGLLTGPPAFRHPEVVDPSQVRRTLRSSHKARIGYVDAAGSSTLRTIWPLALSFFEHSRIVIAHCELRGDFRCFRVDRMTSWESLPERLPRPRMGLLAEWRKREQVPD